MVSKHESQRVVVLVDVQNMYYSAKNLYGKKLNFGALMKKVVGDRKLIRAIAYVIRAEIGEKEDAFFDALQDAGFDIKEKDLQTFVGGAKKGDWDVGISMDAVRYAPKADSIVLVSGDGDFVPMVEYVKQTSGCIMEVAAFGHTCSSKLKEAADEFIDIEKQRPSLLLSYKPTPKPRPAQKPTQTNV